MHRTIDVSLWCMFSLYDDPRMLVFVVNVSTVVVSDTCAVLHATSAGTNTSGANHRSWLCGSSNSCNRISP